MTPGKMATRVQFVSAFQNNPLQKYIQCFSSLLVILYPLQTQMSRKMWFLASASSDSTVCVCGGGSQK